MNITLLRRVISTRYIFLLSALAFILWSLAISIVPKSTTLSALLQVDLARTTATSQHLTKASSGDPSILNSLQIVPSLSIGVVHAHTYVISLPDRHDRRDQMAFLQTIQGLTWTVIDAVPRNATLIDCILDWVAFHRAERRMSVQAGMPGFRWPEEIDVLLVSQGPLRESGSDRWADMSPASKVGLSTYLPCATEDDTIPTFTNDIPEWMFLSPAKIACWHSHVLAIRQFVETQASRAHGSRRGDVAVIFEDDIDMEKNISARLSQVWTFLPAGWDIVFLVGHGVLKDAAALSRSLLVQRIALTAAQGIHGHEPPSVTLPKCSHAYALLSSGAQWVLQHLHYPSFAYSRALDQAYAWLIRSGRLRGYSIVPSVVVQRKNGHSDILPGSGSEWRERLRDGMFEASV